MSHLLELVDVVYHYPSDKTRRRPVLDGVSLGVEPGEALGVVGRNGSGKSTLLKVLANLLRPTSGEVRFDGEPVARRDRAYRSLLNYCAGAPLGFYPRLTAVENLRFFSGMKGRMLSGAEATALLERVGLAASADVTYAKFSLGMRQRTHLAALLLEPSAVWILDEPTTGLDQDGLTLLDDLLTEASARGRTLVVVSHDADFLGRVTSRQVTLAEGRIA
ncbi:heme ABC exporter ATP-binding protein CcmA [Streptomyces sp. NPDC046805]|uniref:heme ABC exporter ATP-binding protein CcmA n=1 Tax=Streptomyces sp. NPDC046805 TaxID=3155134 RepID=UPI0033F4B202